MNKALFVIISGVLLLSAVNAANWAVLVAGSNGFYNYRHQADICHAYQTLVKGGIPAANIILFAFNDIASNPQNPLMGKLVNRMNGPDVYAGCVIDYQGNDVTPTNFLNVLQQNSAAMKNIGTGRVLKSTGADKVFINFSDHGAAGLIAFPNQYLYATDLTPVLTGMWTNKQYLELVFYLEACESGSMFNTFPTNQKLYALTASNPTESSWADYCPPQDMVNGTEIGSCLGDLFSTNWMENTDNTVMTTETLQQQFTVVSGLTTQSQVMQYGDLTFTSEPGSNFIGTGKVSIEEAAKNGHKVQDSRDIKLHYLKNRHLKLNTEVTLRELNEEIASISFYDRTFLGVSKITGDLPFALTTDYTCYKDLIESMENVCGRTSDYGLKYFRPLFNLCACKTCSESKIIVKQFLIQACIEKETIVTA